MNLCSFIKKLPLPTVLEYIKMRFVLLRSDTWTKKGVLEQEMVLESAAAKPKSVFVNAHHHQPAII